METCQRKVNSHSVTRSVYLMGLFDWKLIKEEKHENAPSILYFERNENVPYYQEMVEIEKETSPRLIPFWVLLIFVGIAFGLMTTALILYLSKIKGFDSLANKFFSLIKGRRWFTISKNDLLPAPAPPTEVKIRIGSSFCIL